MKKLLLFFIAISLLGCGEKEENKIKIEEKIVNYDDITIVDEISYYKNDMTLVNGKVLFWQNQDKQKLKAKQTYKDGILNGISKMFYENGKLEGEIPYRDGVVNGGIKMYYENGHLKSEVTYKEGEQEGVIINWYENGQMESEGTTKDGKLYGVNKGWYENGQLKLKITYKDGILVDFLMWDENGVRTNE